MREITFSDPMYEFADLPGCRDAAKLRMALREKEIDLLSKLAVESNGEKELWDDDLSKKCLDVARQYFITGQCLSGDEQNLTKAIENLKGWQNRHIRDRDRTAVVCDLVHNIHMFRNRRAILTDKAYALHLGVLYQQLSVLLIDTVEEHVIKEKNIVIEESLVLSNLIVIPSQFIEYIFSLLEKCEVPKSERSGHIAEIIWTNYKSFSDGRKNDFNKIIFSDEMVSLLNHLFLYQEKVQAVKRSQLRVFHSTLLNILMGLHAFIRGSGCFFSKVISSYPSVLDGLDYPLQKKQLLLIETYLKKYPDILAPSDPINDLFDRFIYAVDKSFNQNTIFDTLQMIFEHEYWQQGFKKYIGELNVNSLLKYYGAAIKIDIINLTLSFSAIASSNAPAYSESELVFSRKVSSSLQLFFSMITTALESQGFNVTHYQLSERKVKKSPDQNEFLKRVFFTHIDEDIPSHKLDSLFTALEN